MFPCDLRCYLHHLRSQTIVVDVLDSLSLSNAAGAALELAFHFHEVDLVVCSKPQPLLHPQLVLH